MLKSFETRIVAHFDLMVEVLGEVGRDPGALLRVVREADEAASDLGRRYDPSRRLGLAYATADTATPFVVRGKEYRQELSEVSGDVRVIYGSANKDIKTTLYADARETIAITPPRAYALPTTWTEVIDRLRAHGLRLERLAEPVTGEFEAYRLAEPVWARQPFEGRHRVSFKTILTRRRRTLTAGTVLVKLDQPAAKVAIHLLEPDAPDSLLSWGFFDSVFEQKEYGEHYALEALARTMLERDPALRAEFFERLQADAAFRADPAARLDFFFRRSSYWDDRKDVYPVIRVANDVPMKTVPYD
jgi:hypothetical protein